MTDNDPIRTLHVDDDPYILDLTSRFLREKDPRFVIKSAISLDEARDVLASTDVECVVCDRDALREGIPELVEEHDDRLPILLYTADKSKRTVREAHEAGVTEYVWKGVDSTQYTRLANRIKHLVAGYRSETRIEVTTDPGGSSCDGAAADHN